MFIHGFQGELSNSRRDKPGANPFGLSGASEDAKSRWREDGFSTEVGHYENELLLRPAKGVGAGSASRRCFQNGGRLPSPVEIEVAMGFKAEYTKVQVGYDRDNL